MQKVINQFGWKKVFCVFLKKKKDSTPWTYVIEDVNIEKLLQLFMNKNKKKKHQSEFRIKKVIKKKGDKLCQMERIQ